MKKISWIDGAAFLLWVLPLAYLATKFSTLPSNVPLHFGLDGKPDKIGSQNDFLIQITILSAISIGVYCLLKFLPSIDPKKAAKYSTSTFTKIGFGLVVFMSVLIISLIYTAKNNAFDLTKLLFPIIGLLFAFVGNLMYNIKPNYFTGIRTPWSLDNEENWKATHRLAGKVWFAGGLLLTIITLLVSNSIGKIVFFSITAIVALIPIIYSYIYFKKQKLN